VSTDWNMPRRNENCAACAREFEVGETFVAALLTTAAGYERRDFCLRCSLPADLRPVGTWRTRRPESTPRKTQAFDREAIYAFFLRLEDARRPEQLQFRFLLALLLWRKKVLKLERSLDMGAHQIWEFSTPRTHETHRVTRPELDESELDRLSTQLETVLAAPPTDPDDILIQFSAEPDHA
jgi:hypothetical protein